MLCDECRQRDASPREEVCTNCQRRTRECKGCQSVLSIFEFEKNQRSPLGKVNRRSECRECRKKREGKKYTLKQKKEFEKSNPRPQIGEQFTCPICLVTFTVGTGNDVNLDHDKETGDIRGWLCGSCNTSMGRFRDDISMLARAIIWLKEKGKMMFSLFTFP